MGRGAGLGATFGFDDFELDLPNGELRKSGVRVKLQRQPLKVLAFLVTNPGRLVTRDEIREEIWGAGTFVDYEHGLNYCIRQIRAALGEDKTTARYIETCPRRGYRFLVRVTERPAPRAASPGRVMLAVLPLENLSRDEEQEYFSDGLTEEIVTELGRVSPGRLGVIARTSAMRYKRTRKGIDEIGRELGVEYIVEGAVRRDGGRVRITAQLIRVSDQTHLWARSYERQLDDVLLLQADLASAIADEIEGTLVPAVRPAPGRTRLVNRDAYEACLKARFLWNRRSRGDLHAALRLFSTALEKDGRWAPAFAGLADTYLVLLDYRYMPPHEALALATGAALNALRLDDRLADAHTSLGHAKMHALDWDGAGNAFTRALELGPGYAPAHFYYANFLICRRRFDDALAQAAEVLELDPLSMAAESNLGIVSSYAGRHADGLARCQRAIEIDPGLPRPYDDMGRILLQTGRAAEAIAPFERAVALSNRSALFLSSLGYAYGVTGRTDPAREILAELTAMAGQRYVGSSDFAFVHAGLGELDRAIAWLGRAREEGDSHLPFLHVDPRLAVLRGEPRFNALLRDLGLEA